MQRLGKWTLNGDGNMQRKLSFLMYGWTSVSKTYRKNKQLNATALKKAKNLKGILGAPWASKKLSRALNFRKLPRKTSDEPE